MDLLPTPNAIDIAALIVLGVGMLRGYLRGLSGELARLASMVTAFIVGLYFYQPLGAWLPEHTRLTERPAHALAFVTTVIGAVIVMIVVRYVLKRIMRVAIEPDVDKMIGCFAGLARAVIVVAIVFFVMNLWPHDYLNRKFGEESVIGRGLLKWMPELREEAGQEAPATTPKQS